MRQKPVSRLLDGPGARSILRDGDRVAVVGGGPAGSFFAHYFLRECRRLNRHIEVVIIERHNASHPHAKGYHSRGCNFCAGGISPRLSEILREHGLIVPESIIKSRVDYVWIHGHWKNFRLRVPKHMEMYSVFRGSLPSIRGNGASGFDQYLLDEAVKEGARVVHGDVQAIATSASKDPILTIGKPDGGKSELDARFVAIAVGINAHPALGNTDDSLTASIKRLNPGFVPGKSRRTLIFELELGEEYLRRHMDREVHFIEYGSRQLSLEHTALVPKGRFLTVAMIGKSIDQAVLPGGGWKIMRSFLALPEISQILPGIESVPFGCACFPVMTVETAREPFGDSFAIIGDAVGSRLYKDGLFSAHVTATRLADAILGEGIDRDALAREYGKTVKWLSADTRYGRAVFNLSRIAFTRPALSRILYQSFSNEFRVRDMDSRPLGALLWKIASGTADYREVLREMGSFSVLWSVFTGTLVTIRNVALELLLGLKWGVAGRYPTVVLKEKRTWAKQYLGSEHGVELDESPDFERMFIIKIRGSRQDIMDELGKFGQPNAPFLNLNFVDVRRIRGNPNQGGSVIRYRIPLFGLRADLHLKSLNSSETLLYDVEERLANRGKLLFNVAPTKDGNNKLTIYAAFDYKNGSSLGGKLLWGAARMLFPEFVHDVVWNHALCTIKERIERYGD